MGNARGSPRHDDRTGTELGWEKVVGIMAWMRETHTTGKHQGFNFDSNVQICAHHPMVSRDSAAHRKSTVQGCKRGFEEGLKSHGQELHILLLPGSP